MKIVYEVNSDNVSKFEIEDEDDLFIFYQLLELGCEVTGQTTRKVTQTAKTGSTVTNKVKAVIRIKVERIEYGTTIAISGLILHCNNPKVQTGRYHTLHVAIGDTISLYKAHWDAMDFVRMHEAANETFKSHLVILGLDGGIAKLWFVSNTSVKEKESIEVNIPKRKNISFKHDNQTEKFYNQIYDMIVKNVNFDDIIALVVAGNFTERNALIKSLMNTAKRMKNPQIQSGIERIVPASATNGILFVVRDVLSDPNLSNILDDCKSYKDMNCVNKFNETMLKSEHLVAIGYEDVTKANEMNALKELFVADELTKICTIERRLKISCLIEESRQKNILVRMLSSKTEAGCEVMRLGGIVAILRYELNLEDEDEGEFVEDYNSEDIDWFGTNVPQSIGDVIDVDDD
ncbi:pelota, putative [Entamoeba dispar SAW760]|uniref:Pelota, putative n=1 Tax=Entamoeba dispar (strain ATCC PRA-260 / SAW760) TaxID=370354 RepID=B0EC27_ENTDS|nr:pelota, putative [Entamoeba dispar SAW760]EDR27917.1 pelota, putative [Entamoeba dispar SAW760]|eukprot:EDR27917.1 pelota, putative [Entamoeba dispar SAW760]